MTEVKTSLVIEEEAQKARMSEICNLMKRKRDEYSKAEKELSALKKEFKELAAKMGVSQFETPEAAVSITEIDKSFLDEKPTIQYLKDHGLSDYIHSKEYFEYAELGMGVTQNKINAAELNQFLIKKVETRINIK